MVYNLRFFLQNAVCFIILTYLVPVLFTFYTQGVLKLKKNNSGAKRLSNVRQHNYFITQGNYTGYMFRLLISHFRPILSIESQDVMHTLGSHRVYIHGNT